MGFCKRIKVMRVCWFLLKNINFRSNRNLRFCHAGELDHEEKLIQIKSAGGMVVDFSLPVFSKSLLSDWR